ncbi:hypothetical protein Golomagni_06646 [Golovinomyces magnicellulatus]|nr:hypothetical protein Golomagni_06646 [Golovinomyces magnicellulatus]
MAMPRVFLARHGETEWSISGQHTGRSDIPLTPHGEEVMRQLAPSIVGVGNGKLIDPTKLNHIFVSPRTRSQRTLQIMLDHIPASEREHIPQVEILQDCREWDYGAYEGLKTDQIREKHPGWDIWTEGTPDHPERPDELPGESAQHMSDRIDSVIAKIRELQSGHVDKRNQGHDVGAKTCDVLLVCHGHFNRVFIARWLGLPLTNGRLFEMDAGGMVVLGYAHHNFAEPTIAGMLGQARRVAVSRARLAHHLDGRGAVRPHGHGHRGAVCTAAAALRPRRRHAAAAHHQARLLPRRTRGAALVRGGQDRLQAAHGQGRAHLGLQRFARVSGFARPAPSSRGRSRPRVRLPVASLWRRIQGLRCRLYGAGGGPAAPGDRQDQKQSYRPTHPPQRVESARPRAHGAAAVPYVLPVLRVQPGRARARRGQEAALVPNVPALVRSRAGRAVQHRELCAAHLHGRQGDRLRAQGTHPLHGRRTRVQGPHRAPQSPARTPASALPQTQLQAPHHRHRRLYLRRL